LSDGSSERTVLVSEQSFSRRSSGIVAQFTFTKGHSERDFRRE
jgi:hypothetical protein